MRGFAWLGAGSETLQIDDVGTAGKPGFVQQDTDFAAHVGIGAKYLLTDRWLVRAEVRYVNTAARLHDQTTHNWEFSLALGMVLGSKPKDRDRDGIDDLRDQCPDEAEDKDGFEDNDGCRDDDNDGDGVLDLMDQCTEAEDRDGFEDGDGCPDPDNDGDGILDAADKCPNDKENINGVDDTDGCPDEDRKPRVVVTREEVQVNEKILFAVGAALIEQRSYPLLDEVAAVLLAHPQLTRVRVEGHTDDKGKPSANVRLSQRRAAAVAKYLASKGVSAKRLVSKGYGSAKPICMDKGQDAQFTDACRDRNRRVQFRILEVDGKPLADGQSAVIETRALQKP